jgi:two-component system phosphate regulon sensor histidine kinase PhoR
MPRSKPRLVLYLLLPYVLTVPPLVGAGYLFFRRAVDNAATEVAGAIALQEAHSIAARLPVGVPPDELERRCREEVRASATRLTVIAEDGRVLCDSEADPTRMVNHLQRPEVVQALREGAGFDRRESATVHYPLVYAAILAGDGPSRRIVRVAIPADVLAGPHRHLALALLLTVLVTVAIAFLPALYVANRIGRRLERMVGFSRAVAHGDFSTRLPVARGDELGALEDNLNQMAERLRASFRELGDESEKIRGMLGAMVEGVVVISRAGEVILMNRRAEAIFEVGSGSEYRGRHLVEMCRDPELQDALRGLDGVTNPGVEGREIVLAHGDRRFLALSISPLTGAAGELAGFVLVFHDVTDLKRLETMRRDFVANVSHELRTPLTAIRGYAETLLAGAFEDRTRARQFLSVIDRHSERLSRLIDDLLTLSDLELGKAAIKRDAVQLDVLVDEVLEVLGEKAMRGSVTLEKAIPPDVPLLIGDADRLQQVLINLTDNAVKYTPAGGHVTVGARLAVNGASPLVEIEVRDTGAGIPAADLPRLTERFYRVDKARSRELGGTGLGLAIVKHLVQAHGGRLEILSEMNVGTIVRFSVPGWAPGREP